MPGASVFVRAIFCILLFNVQAIAQSHLLFSDREYESPGGARTQLDIIMPDFGPRPGTPTIVYIHGGAWHTRDKTDDMPLYIELTKHGYAVVACNYTLASSGNASFPQAVQDVKNVLRWVRVEGHHFNLSPVIVVCGPSAGGHLAMMAALTSGMPEFETLSRPLGGYRPQAFISLAGFTDLEWHAATQGQSQMFNRFLGDWYTPETVALYRSASPIFHVSHCDPPGALLHGDVDEVVPCEHALMFIDAMELKRIPAYLKVVENAGHSFDPYGGQVGVARRLAALIPMLEADFVTPDLDGDGALTVDDFFAMVDLYAIADPRADINGDEKFNIDDFVAYMNLFAVGC